MAENKKISLIEDDHAIRLMYIHMLEKEGFDVSFAENGKEGLELIDRVRPDLILLDLMMPIMSGDKMLAELRKTNWGSTVKVIVLTNVSRDEAPLILKVLHVDRYIVKVQFTPSQVVEIVNKVLEP
jgi:DNA-binding response OmpR family regulator